MAKKGAADKVGDWCFSALAADGSVFFTTPSPAEELARANHALGQAQEERDRLREEVRRLDASRSGLIAKNIILERRFAAQAEALVEAQADQAKLRQLVLGDATPRERIALANIVQGNVDGLASTGSCIYQAHRDARTAWLDVRDQWDE